MIVGSVLLLALIAIAVIGCLLFYAFLTVDAAAGDAVGLKKGIIASLVPALPYGGMLLFIVGTGIAVYWMGASGVVMVVIGFVLFVDAFLSMMALDPVKEKDKTITNFAGNRSLFILDLLSLALPFVVVAVVVFVMGWIPDMVRPAVYGSMAGEVFFLVLFFVFMEANNRRYSSYDFSDEKWSFFARNVFLVCAAVAIVYLLSVGFAPTANTYHHFMTPEKGQSVGWFMQTGAVVSAAGVCLVTAPFAPIWVPFYYWGFGLGLLALALEALVGFLVGASFSEIFSRKRRANRWEDKTK